MALERAIGLGIERERRPTDDIVVVGFSAISGLGGTAETWNGLLQGKSAVRQYDMNNPFASIAAPLLDFNPSQYISVKDQRNTSRLAQLDVFLTDKAGEHAGIIEKDGERFRFINGIDPKKVGFWIGSGFSSAGHIIEVHKTVREKGAARVGLREGLKTFPEQPNSAGAGAVGGKGWSGNTVEACATGLSNINQAAMLMKYGYADVAFCGGVEDSLHENAESTIATFTGMQKVLSKRNDDPEGASRPFDRDRDGFVLAAGGAVAVLMRGDLVRKLNTLDGINIRPYAKVVGFEKSIDGINPTMLDSRNVARTIAQSLYHEKTGTMMSIDAIFAHATSTPEGDEGEKEALAFVFGDMLRHIPITAIKGALGHQAGGAGATNFVAAIMAMNEGIIPHILNLMNPLDENLDFVRNAPRRVNLHRVLVTAYGFGGYNASTVLELPDTSSYGYIPDVK